MVRESGVNQSFYNIVLVEENSWTQQNTPRKKSLSKIQKVSLCKFVHKLTLNFTSKKDYTSVKTPLVKKERRRFFLFFSVFSIFSPVYLFNEGSISFIKIILLFYLTPLPPKKLTKLFIFILFGFLF